MSGLFRLVTCAVVTRRLRCVSSAIAVAVAFCPAHAAGPPSVAVRLELTTGEAITGDLLAVTADTIRATIAGQPREFPTASVRRLVRERAAEPPRLPVVVTTSAGGSLAGTGCRQEGERLVIDRAEGPISLAANRVARVVWLADDEQQPAWLDQAPPKPAADLVVIRKDGGHTFVECAVTGLTDDAVTVVLDGETIPVKRGKVAGIIWLREPETTASGPAVTFAGGRLAAAEVRWSPDAFVVDDSTRLPPGLLESIDYAAGRTVVLTSLEPEAVAVEPAFGGLAGIEGLKGFFAPRSVPPTGDGGPGALILRPRTVISWRVPDKARVFRVQLARDVPDTSPEAVEVAVAVDDREACRVGLGPSGSAPGESPRPGPLEADVSSGRRLTITVDFVGGSLGCPVRLTEPVFEQ